MFEALRDGDTVFSGALTLSGGRLSASVRLGGVEMSDVHFSPVSTSYFDVLGVTPVMGHSFDQRDNAPDAAVISYGFWQRSCGSDPQVIGKVLRFAGRTYTIAGIAPPGFTGIAVGQPIDVWIPITWIPRQTLQNSRRVHPSYHCAAQTRGHGAAGPNRCRTRRQATQYRMGI